MSLNTKIKILVIEDENAIRKFLKAGMPEEYQLLEAESGEEGLRMIATHNPEIVLLDLGLPKIDGLDVIKNLRVWSKVPVIVLSARGQEEDKINALDLGAEDYLTKPFSIGELLARIRVLLRTKSIISPRGVVSNFETGDLKIDFAKRDVTLAGIAIHLTPIEYKLLCTLVQNPGKVLTHKFLLNQVWGNAYTRDTHYLRVYMKQLRHKLETTPSQPTMIITESGIGYRFKATQ